MKQHYTCIIVDDERHAIEQLEDLLMAQYPDMQISGKFTRWQDALEHLQLEAADLVFMDIRMPQRSGIEVVRLMPDLPAEIIFVTADPAYALEAFDLQVGGYILKPIDELLLKKTVDKALSRIQDRRLNKPVQHSGLKRKISIPNEEGMIYVSTEDILYIESAMRCTKVTGTKKQITSSYPIGKFRTILEEPFFLQTHRFFIVNLNHVQEYKKRGSVIMSDGKEIPVAKQVRAEFLNLFQQVSK